MEDEAPVRRAVGRALVRASEAGLAALGVERPAALLVLGHMRSGSTLLLHVLLTNPAFAAIGERNAIYQSEADLARLAVATRASRRRPFARLRYVVDQINHNRFTPDAALFEHPRVHLVFLVRAPEPSIASLLELTRTYYEPWSVERAVDYYVDRVDALARYGRVLSSGDRAAFLTYDDLTERPSDTLACLSAFLSAGAFSAQYETHDFTGRRGDPGANIHSGRIGRPRPRAPIALSADALARANRAYDRCREALTRVSLSRFAHNSSGGGMHVRSADASDLDRLATVWHDGWRDAHLAIVPPELTKLRTLESFRHRLQAGLSEVRVVGPAGAPLGFSMLKDDELYQLYVSAAARGTGVAAALIDDAEARLAERGVAVAWLACAIGNDRAARFYEKRGWRRVGTMVNQLETTAPEIFPLEVWRYEKPLTPPLPARAEA